MSAYRLSITTDGEETWAVEFTPPERRTAPDFKIIGPERPDQADGEALIYGETMLRALYAAVNAGIPVRHREQEPTDG